MIPVKACSVSVKNNKVFSQGFKIITDRKSNCNFASMVSVNSLLLDKCNRG